MVVLVVIARWFVRYAVGVVAGISYHILSETIAKFIVVPASQPQQPSNTHTVTQSPY